MLLVHVCNLLRVIVYSTILICNVKPAIIDFFNGTVCALTLNKFIFETHEENVWMREDINSLRLVLVLKISP